MTIEILTFYVNCLHLYFDNKYTCKRNNCSKLKSFSKSYLLQYSLDKIFLVA